jgi:CheY-like chemotaxis protein
MSKFKVLFIDDEEELVSTLVERLKFRDIAGAYELNGASAIERLRREKFDVVVVDLELPILLITGHGSPLEEEDIPKGIEDILAKPIKLDLLVEKIQAALQAK